MLSAFLRVHLGCWQRALFKLIWKTMGLDSVIPNFQKRQRCQNPIPAHSKSLVQRGWQKGPGDTGEDKDLEDQDVSQSRSHLGGALKDKQGFAGSLWRKSILGEGNRMCKGSEALHNSSLSRITWESSCLEMGMNTMTFLCLGCWKVFAAFRRQCVFGNYLLFIFVIIIVKKVKVERVKKSFYDSKMLGKWQIRIRTQVSYKYIERKINKIFWAFLLNQCQSGCSL